MIAVKFIGQLLIFLFLTILTQIGGLVWLVNTLFFKLRKSNTKRGIQIISFVTVYLICTLLIVPQLARLNNRTALPVVKTGNLVPHTMITPLLNRNYVTPTLKSDLLSIADRMEESGNLKLSYLDANFPFIDGFPLIPHLSHNDGRKVDLAFYYTKENKTGNLKPARSGYGAYVEPADGQENTSRICKSKGHKLYDITRYITLGTRDDLKFDPKSTKRLIRLLLKSKHCQKIFLEPHLKKSLNLSNKKIRFHGCHSVRHDDHIHYQIH